MPTANDKPFVSVSLPTEKGMVHARHYVVVECRYAVVLVGDGNATFESPADNLYGRLAESLKQDGITALQVALCRPEDEPLSSHDVRTGIHYLCSLGSKTVILVGFGRGATAVLGAVSHESCVSGVALLSAPGDAEIGDLSPCSLLIIRTQPGAPAEGTAGTEHIFKGDHSLAGHADEVYELISAWIRRVREDHNAQAA